MLSPAERIAMVWPLTLRAWIDRDFVEMLSALSAEGAEYLLVGSASP